MLDQILVPLDGSLLAENILPHAVAVSKAYNSEITLISVLDPLNGSMSSQPVNLFDWQIQRAEMELHLEQVSSRFQEHGLKVRTIFLEGRAADRIVDYAAHMGTNLIMLSSHGQGGISDWNNSSVATKISQQARTSVMIIRSYASPQPNPIQHSYRRILVPVDGSRRAEYALFSAAQLARDQGAELIIAHVVKPPELPRRTPLSFTDRRITRLVVESNQAEASQYLEALITSLDCKVETRLLIGDSVAEALHTLAEREQIDLVILNAHGLGGESLRPFGSITLNFLAYSTIALLIVQDFARQQLPETKAETYANGFLGQPPKILSEARQNDWERPSPHP